MKIFASVKRLFARQPPLQVFLSSTSDLRPERAAITKDLPESFTAYDSEYDWGGGGTPEDRLGNILDGTAVFVGLVGGRWGSPHPRAGDKSICEWEFEQARNRDLDLLPFVKELPPDEIEEPQRRFREEISGFSDGLWCSIYHSPEEAASQVRRRLGGWLREFADRMDSASNETRGARRLRRKISLALVGVVFLGGAWLITQQLTFWGLGVMALAFVFLAALNHLDSYEWRSDG